MHYTQIVLTDSQAGFAASAVSKAAGEATHEQEREQLSQLADFLFSVANNPTAFPIKTPAMARAIRKRVARLKGPAQPQKPNARKRAQERSQGSQKRTRAQKRADAAAWNEICAQFEAAMENAKAQRAALADTHGDDRKKRIALPWSKKEIREGK